MVTNESAAPSKKFGFRKIVLWPVPAAYGSGSICAQLALHRKFLGPG